MSYVVNYTLNIENFNIPRDFIEIKNKDLEQNILKLKSLIPLKDEEITLRDHKLREELKNKIFVNKNKYGIKIKICYEYNNKVRNKIGNEDILYVIKEDCLLLPNYDSNLKIFKLNEKKEYVHRDKTIYINDRNGEIEVYQEIFKKCKLTGEIYESSNEDEDYSDLSHIKYTNGVEKYLKTKDLTQQQVNSYLGL